MGLDWETSSPPQRVVSLVPSITGSFFDLGLGDSLIAVSTYCQPPIDTQQRLIQIGGPKTIDVQKIAELQPDLVIANREENTQEDIEALEQEGLKIWLTFPCTVSQSIAFLWDIVYLFQAPEASHQLRMLETTLEWTLKATSEQPRARYFSPVWQEESPESGFWWMTFNQATYSHDLLACCGGENVFSERERCYPLAADLGQSAKEAPRGRDTRYPRVRPEEVLAAQPEVILLPSEPFHFTDEDAKMLCSRLERTPAVQEDRVYLVDGRIIHWPGTQLAEALSEIPPLFQTF